MNYFEGITSIEAAKQRYKELAKQYHPDKGGCVEVMKAINAQYEKVAEGIFQKGGKSITEIEELLKNDLALREKIDAISGIDGVDVEICGSWVWVTGNTKEFKDLLKTAGYFWASKKLAWYWRKEDKKSCNRTSWDLDKIRSNYGSLSIKNERRAAIA